MLGIAVATYNRASSLERLLNDIRRTSVANTTIVVCNDGSSDNTLEVCANLKVKAIGERNKGIAWNKNRGLFYLMERTQAENILVIEDDILIRREDWLSDWTQAIHLWNHVTWADAELNKARQDRYINGSGTPSDPYILKYVTGQVMAFSRTALSKVGYFDTRFLGYGYEHIDLSRRLHRSGYGTKEALNKVSGNMESGYVNISGGIEISDLPTVSDRSTTEDNRKIYETLRSESAFRHAWRNDQEQQELLAELSTMKVHG